jgi:hypothetical protein
MTKKEMAAGPKSWFGLQDPFMDKWEAEQRRADGHGHDHDHDHGHQAQTVSHVLILHKSESVPWQAAVGVLENAGIGADVALRLLTGVNERGQALVAQGTDTNMALLAGMFTEIGMKTTIQPGSAPTQ